MIHHLQVPSPTYSQNMKIVEILTPEANISNQHSFNDTSSSSSTLNIHDLQAFSFQELSPMSLRALQPGYRHHAYIHHILKDRCAGIRQDSIHDEQPGMPSLHRCNRLLENFTAGVIRPVVEYVAKEVDMCVF